MTVRMTAAAADQVFLVSDQDSPTRQLLLSAQKLKTCFFFFIFIKRKQKTGKVVFVTQRLLCLCVQAQFVLVCARGLETEYSVAGL